MVLIMLISLSTECRSVVMSFVSVFPKRRARRRWLHPKTWRPMFMVFVSLSRQVMMVFYFMWWMGGMGGLAAMGLRTVTSAIRCPFFVFVHRGWRGWGGDSTSGALAWTGLCWTHSSFLFLLLLLCLPLKLWFGCLHMQYWGTCTRGPTRVPCTMTNCRRWPVHPPRRLSTLICPPLTPYCLHELHANTTVISIRSKFALVIFISSSLNDHLYSFVIKFFHLQLAYVVKFTLLSS